MTTAKMKPRPEVEALNDLSKRMREHPDAPLIAIPRENAEAIQKHLGLHFGSNLPPRDLLQRLFDQRWGALDAECGLMQLVIGQLETLTTALISHGMLGGKDGSEENGSEEVSSETPGHEEEDGQVDQAQDG
ncbi:MAG TPA: hypothetical protein ENJ16_06520 [Planctomycetaceae bacterium]|nr:hypothetical protein [Planctomycetaceae bacterium]